MVGQAKVAQKWGQAKNAIALKSSSCLQLLTLLTRLNVAELFACTRGTVTYVWGQAKYKAT